MRRRKITCLSMALIISILLTGCGLGDIPVVGKLFEKDSGEQSGSNVDIQDDSNQSSGQNIDAEYPAVPIGTVITVDDIFDVLSSAGLSADTVAGYLILNEFGDEVDELLVTQDTHFTFIYQMRGAEANEQSQLVIGVKVTEESVDSSDDMLESEHYDEYNTEEVQYPSAARYEVFDYADATSEAFTFSNLENGTLYVNNIFNFDISKIPHYYEYDSISKGLYNLTNYYTDVNAEISSKFKVYCIPKAFLYMQASDYDEGADMSAYTGEYVLALEPEYSSYTDAIYQSEDILLLPLIDDVNRFAEEISDEAKSECDFLMDESFDDDSTDIDDFYGSMEILLRLADTEDVFIFDDVFRVNIVDYSDMGTPDNMSDDIPWEEYENGIISSNTNTSTEAETSTEVSNGSTTITETTTTTTTTESVIQAITSDVANSFRSRHPELFTFFPDTEMIYSKWDWRIGDSTTIKGTITLRDGTVLPGLSYSETGTVYNITDGSVVSSGSTGSSNAFGSTDYTGGVFSSTSSSDTIEDPVMTGEIETQEPEEEPAIDEYEISLGNTRCKVTANNTYRYMIDNQNSSSSEVFVNHRDKRYTIKIVDQSGYEKYRTSDYLSRNLNRYSIIASDYTGSTDADNTSIVLIDIQYETSTGEVTEPYMAYIRNGDEYVIIIPDEAESENSDVLADILKRCVSLH